MENLRWAENLLNAVLILAGLWLTAGLNYPYGWALLALGTFYLGFRGRHLFFLYRARGAFARGGLEAALEWYSRAYTTGNLNLQTTVTYAYLSLKAGDNQTADKILGKEKKRRSRLSLYHPEVSFIRSYQALVDWKKGDLEGALEICQDLLGHGYQNAAVYGSLGYFLLEKKMYSQALEINREAAEYAENDPVILDNLAATYRLMMNYTDAKGVFDRLIELDPGFPEAWYNYGLFLMETGHKEEAQKAFRKALELPFTAMTTVRRGQIETALG